MTVTGALVVPAPQSPQILPEIALLVSLLPAHANRAETKPPNSPRGHPQHLGDLGNGQQRLDEPVVRLHRSTVHRVPVDLAHQSRRQGARLHEGTIGAPEGLHGSPQVAGDAVEHRPRWMCRRCRQLRRCDTRRLCSVSQQNIPRNLHHRPRPFSADFG